MVDKLKLTDDEWRARLTDEEYQVLRRHGTERAGTGCLLATKDPGTYVCAGCHNPLFPSGEKFESGTGWPSFTRPLSPDALTTIEDRSYGMTRTEVRCGRCETPLCTRCAVHGPAGVRCRACARNRVPVRPIGVLHEVGRTVSDPNTGRQAVWYMVLFSFVLSFFSGIFGGRRD